MDRSDAVREVHSWSGACSHGAGNSALLGGVTGETKIVQSLGLLSVDEKSSALALYSDELLRLAWGLPSEERARTAAYLRSGTIVFAATEHTVDVIDGMFQTPGGSAIVTAGSYFWRRDCAEYVEHYGVELPDQFVEHVQRLNWTAPHVRRERLVEVDRHLRASDGACRPN